MPRLQTELPHLETIYPRAFDWFDIVFIQFLLLLGIKGTDSISPRHRIHVLYKYAF